MDIDTLHDFCAKIPIVSITIDFECLPLHSSNQGTQLYVFSLLSAGIKIPPLFILGPIKGGLNVGCRLEFFGNVECRADNSECPCQPTLILV